MVGWGLVTNTYASWLTWQGYLLGPLGLGGKTGAWAFANLGVLVALVLGFVSRLASLGLHAGAGPGVPACAGPASRPPPDGPPAWAAAWPSSTCSGCSPSRAAPGWRRTVRRDHRAGRQAGGGASQPHVVFTRFVAPAEPHGCLAGLLRGLAVRAAAAGRATSTSWWTTFAAWSGPTLDAITFSKWGPELAASGRTVGGWCWPGCPPTAACCPPRWRRPTTGSRSRWWRTRAPGRPTRATATPWTSCALYAPLIEVVGPRGHAGRMTGGAGPGRGCAVRAGHRRRARHADRVAAPVADRRQVRAAAGLVPAGRRGPAAGAWAAGRHGDRRHRAGAAAGRAADRGRRPDRRGRVRPAAARPGKSRCGCAARSDLLGPSTKRALAALLAGTDIAETGRYGSTNGAAMRITPVGVATPAR